jgi:hypothetical protein
MNPTMMLTLLVSAWAAFAWSANRRWQLLKVGRSENRLDSVGTRLKVLYEYAIVQKKMNYYPLAGIAHKLIFVGFVVLLLRSLILWGRGFDPAFNFGIFGEAPVRLPLLGSVALGHVYEFAKDLSAIVVLLGVGVFLYYRLVRHEKRMSLHPEGLVILGIIATMMIADMVYDGASSRCARSSVVSVRRRPGDAATLATGRAPCCALPPARVGRGRLHGRPRGRSSPTLSEWECASSCSTLTPGSGRIRPSCSFS